MTIPERVAERGVQEIVHFTTNHGCLGSLYTKLLQSRQQLRGDPLVEYLFEPNVAFRKDTAFVDYVSLSVSHINTDFYRTCADSWHRDEPIFWCIMSFDPAVLGHPGVIFATTNNIYTGVTRGQGLAGFDGMFAKTITRWHGNVVHRANHLPANLPTCTQAEALVPTAVSTDYLQRIYVQSANDQSEVVGFTKATFHRDIDVVVDPAKFGSRI
ncbi:DarT ssDNA thymidine ADP-ribosyltransferase family protein [Mesorhizobium sp. B2-5-3]|uniref:DarT ssDNA thymidine ADP-ribosyltransferase family protein n=1 Tax=Mesorhizobium sp. B2-5-3 TaxID=2589927 RepID=UPI001127451C|nr:DarT ssDNA thymidine ADP-ribosyltransferase family protein [Mesorhizobium sp. B2-5-3]TPK40992.1 DUF4433 domain-containing protein [Mesorhizobium sp. B2-5-3]